MAPPTNRQPIGSQKSNKQNNKFKQVQLFYKNYINLNYLKYLILDPASLPIVSILILLAEFCLNIFVIWRVKYTEIDWIAYMQECEGFLNGTTNYAELRGDTGPLVYPAAFVYIYSTLYFITSYGKNIRLAQYIFVGIYLVQMWLVLRLYTKSRKVPPYVVVISAFTSYRIHSIYILRLFNDPIAILFLYASLNLFLERKWSWGSVLFSIAVGVKMNILLFAPALLLFYIINLGYVKAFIQLFICGLVQLILGAPFLLTYPLQYLKGSFDLGRIFEHKWTVNYRFLTKLNFESKNFHLTLLALHLILLGIFAKPTIKFFQNYRNLRELQKQLQPQLKRKNDELKTKPIKTKKTKKSNNEEKLTKEQEQFLKSFEKGLQKTTGVKAPIKTAQQEKITKQQDDEKVKKVSIHFDKCIQLALLPFFLCNFIGILCARSLHYQFYVWYFHSLPYLTWSTNYSLGVRFLLLGLIEFSWNTYPSTNFSSAILHASHLILLFGIGWNVFKTVKESNTIKNQRLENENRRVATNGNIKND